MRSFCGRTDRSPGSLRDRLSDFAERYPEWGTDFHRSSRYNEFIVLNIKKEVCSMSWTIEKANEQFEVFKQRAAEDAQFRALALTSPKQAIRELTGLELPEGIEVVISEDENGEIQAKALLSVPSSDAERELDDAELEHVAGGTTFASFIQYDSTVPSGMPPKRR